MEYYTCGHIAECDDNGEYVNGSYALWETTTRDWQHATAYGVLCYKCFPLYEARKCKIGGAEIEN